MSLYHKRMLRALCVLLGTAFFLHGCMKAKRMQSKNISVSPLVKALWNNPPPTSLEEARNEIATLGAFINFNKQSRLKQAKHLPPDQRVLQCKRICQAADGICRSAKRICLISKKYPKEQGFQRICRSAMNDCNGGQQSCRTCKP